MTTGRPASVVVGLSYGYHDAAVAVLVDGEIVAAAEEERFSRRKHDSSLPAAALAASLDAAGLTAGDIDEVVYYEKPLPLLSRYVATRQRQGPSGMRQFVAEMPALVRHNLGLGYAVGGLLRDLGHPDPPPLRFVEHHRSHAAAAFFPSPFRSAAVLTVDGIGEWATASIGHGDGQQLTLLEELRFPDSVGLVYSMVTAWCGFAPNDGEYKVMGLAPYGEPRFADALAALAPLSDDGAPAVDAKRFGWFSDRGLRSDELAEMFDGAPRRPEDELTQRDADLAASVQQYTETAMMAMARRAHELTGETDVCLAGGVALNGVANGRIRRDGPFEAVWAQPAAGDSGSAIGAALAYWYDTYRWPRPERSGDGMSGALLGPAIAATDATEELEGLDVPFRVVEGGELASMVSERLAAGDIVGWVQGRMEFGPRALGNRSILADPRDPAVRERLNAAVKGRESFRPFAPAVLSERADEWFECAGDLPYMLFVVDVAVDRLLEVEREPDGFAARGRVPRSQIPACTHIDGSARVQTVDRAINPRFHELLSAFDALTGCPVLVNTSFNRAGEPIVASAADAVRTAAAAGLDLLVIGDLVVEDAALARLAASPDPALPDAEAA